MKSKMTYCSLYVRELSVCSLCSLPLFWYEHEGVFDGPTFTLFQGERGLPHDPPLFIYFILSLACWVKRELKLREL